MNQPTEEHPTPIRRRTRRAPFLLRKPLLSAFIVFVVIYLTFATVAAFALEPEMADIEVLRARFERALTISFSTALAFYLTLKWRP